MPDNMSSLFEFDQSAREIRCIGNWTVLNMDGLAAKLIELINCTEESLNINGKELKAMDSAGALALHNAITHSESVNKAVSLHSFNKQQNAMLKLVKEQEEHLHYEPPKQTKDNIFALIGKETISKLLQADGLIILVGELSSKLFIAFGQWRKLHVPSVVSNIFTAGIQALPILALLSFLIGVVLAYQMGIQLQTYGANIYIAYLCGIANFREFGPLITAIIVAGRTSSAYTAQLGSMKINEEVDALRTMGLSPVELLVMPKVIGLTLVFPLLIFWADSFAIFGSMFMSKFMLEVSYVDFLARIKSSVGVKHMLLGLYKAPAFAILIALVGCFQGFRVESNADSIGSQTTRSVVQALFLIIIADAVFSIVYSWLDL